MTITLYEKALREIRRDKPDIALVIKLLNAGVEGGDPRAAYALATWYLHGEHVRKNRRRAVELLKQAAEKNVPDACFDLAVYFEKNKDKKSAFAHYLKAAIRGDAQAIFAVGRCYYHGIGVAKSKSMADIWLDRAEELGVVD